MRGLLLLLLVLLRCWFAFFFFPLIFWESVRKRKVSFWQMPTRSQKASNFVREIKKNPPPRFDSRQTSNPPIVFWRSSIIFLSSRRSIEHRFHSHLESGFSAVSLEILPFGVVSGGEVRRMRQSFTEMVGSFLFLSTFFHEFVGSGLGIKKRPVLYRRT